MKISYEGQIRDGTLHIFHRKDFIKDLQNFDPKKKLVITVQTKKKQRSIEQNRYYWAVVLPIVRHGLLDTGYKVGIEETHELMKYKFNLKEIVNEQTGEIMQTIGSSTKMTTTQMMEYFQDIAIWALEYLNIHIPQPGEQLRIDEEIL